MWSEISKLLTSCKYKQMRDVITDVDNEINLKACLSSADAAIRLRKSGQRFRENSSTAGAFSLLQTELGNRDWSAKSWLI